MKFTKKDALLECYQMWKYIVDKLPSRNLDEDTINKLKKSYEDHVGKSFKLSCPCCEYVYKLPINDRCGYLKDCSECPLIDVWTRNSNDEPVGLPSIICEKHVNSPWNKVQDCRSYKAKKKYSEIIRDEAYKLYRKELRRERKG